MTNYTGSPTTTIPPADTSTGAMKGTPDPRGRHRRRRTWLSLGVAAALAVGGASALAITNADDAVPSPADERPTTEEITRRLVQNGYLPEETLQEAPSTSETITRRLVQNGYLPKEALEEAPTS